MGFILRSLLVIGTFLGLLVLWSSLTPKDNRDNPFEKRVSTQQALSHTSVTDTRCCTVCRAVSDAVVWTLAAVQSLLLTAPRLPAFISAYVTMLESKAEVGCKSCSGIAVFLQSIQMIACRHMTGVPLSHTVMASGRLLVQ